MRIVRSTWQRATLAAALSLIGSLILGSWTAFAGGAEGDSFVFSRSVALPGQNVRLCAINYYQKRSANVDLTIANPGDMTNVLAYERIEIAPGGDACIVYPSLGANSATQPITALITNIWGPHRPPCLYGQPDNPPWADVKIDVCKIVGSLELFDAVTGAILLHLEPVRLPAVFRALP